MQIQFLQEKHVYRTILSRQVRFERKIDERLDYHLTFVEICIYHISVTLHAVQHDTLLDNDFDVTNLTILASQACYHKRHEDKRHGLRC